MDNATKMTPEEMVAESSRKKAAAERLNAESEALMKMARKTCRHPSVDWEEDTDGYVYFKVGRCRVCGAKVDP